MCVWSEGGQACTAYSLANGGADPPALRLGGFRDYHKGALLTVIQGDCHSS